LNFGRTTLSHSERKINNIDGNFQKRLMFAQNMIEFGKHKQSIFEKLPTPNIVGG
jgi:hypothetical protein